MSTPVRILAFAASARAASLNRKLLAATVDAVRAVGAEVTLIDLNDFTLPLYHGDLEDREGLPPAAAALIAQIQAHQGLLIASPEYNGMITPLLKNTIDWCTRGDDDPFPGKVAAVVSASPGAFGGMRSHQLAQQLLLKLGCHVVPAVTTLAQADKAFDADGHLTDARAQKSVKALATSLVALTRSVG
ncbi:MAG TPA: NAD(P)H-dependent oxidoreductase [Opitutaceae bacterium]